MLMFNRIQRLLFLRQQLGLLILLRFLVAQFFLDLLQRPDVLLMMRLCISLLSLQSVVIDRLLEATQNTDCRFDTLPGLVIFNNAKAQLQLVQMVGFGLPLAFGFFRAGLVL